MTTLDNVPQYNFQLSPEGLKQTLAISYFKDLQNDIYTY